MILQMLTLLVPFALWVLPAHLTGRHARRNGLVFEEYFMLAMVLPVIAQVALRNDIRVEKGLPRKRFGRI